MQIPLFLRAVEVTALSFLRAVEVTGFRGKALYPMIDL